MHNFKSEKRSSTKSSGQAVDGIISPRKTGGSSSRSTTGMTTPSGQIRRVRSYRPEVAPMRARTTGLGEFRQPVTESLAASAQPLRVSSSTVALEQPWGRNTGKEADSRGAKKRRWPFGKKKSGRGKTPTSRKKKILKAFLIIAVLLVLVGGFLAAKTWWNARKILTGGGSAPSKQSVARP